MRINLPSLLTPSTGLSLTVEENSPGLSSKLKVFPLLFRVLEQGPLKKFQS